MIKIVSWLTEAVNQKKVSRLLFGFERGTITGGILSMVVGGFIVYREPGPFTISGTPFIMQPRFYAIVVRK